MQQYAGIYLLQVYSKYFGRPSSPSSGVQKTLTAVFDTGHSNGAMTFCTPDDGRDGRPKHVE